MNVLDRVQGYNRIIVQGRREIEDQQMEERGFEEWRSLRGENRRGKP